PSPRRARRIARGLSPGATMLSYLVLGAWSAVVLFPLYWIAITSLKLPVQVYSGPVYLPFVDYQPSLHAWQYIFVDLRTDTLRPFVNTVVVAVTSSILALVLGTAAGYGLLRFRYRPRLGVVLSFVGSVLLMAVAIGLTVPWSIAAAAGGALFLVSWQTTRRRFRRTLAHEDIALWRVSQRILPPVAVVIPVYVMFQRLGLLDTWAALIITYTAVSLPIVVWLMRDYIRTISLELEESAALDGASPFRI